MPVPADFRDGDANGFDARGRMALASIHHYTTRSLEDFIVKSARGDVVFPNRRLGSRYWRTRNAGEVEDTSLATWPPGALTILDDLLSNPALASLHQAAEAAHIARIAALRDDDAYADLWALPD